MKIVKKYPMWNIQSHQIRESLIDYIVKYFPILDCPNALHLNTVCLASIFRALGGEGLLSCMKLD